MSNSLSPLDMHIEVLQGLQKLDSYQQDMFEPEEIDFQLNKQQDRFVENLVNQNFEHEQVRLDYLRDLIVKNRSLLTYINTETNYSSSEGQEVYAILPSDYLHLVSDRSVVLTNTDPTCQTSIEDLTGVVTTFNESIALLKLPQPALDPEGTDTYYIDLILNIDGTEVYKTNFNVDDSDLSQGSKITDPNFLSPLIKDILDKVNVSAIPGLSNDRVYWENYRGQYYPQTFIFVKDPGSSTDLPSIPFPTTLGFNDKDSLGNPLSNSVATIENVTYNVVSRGLDSDSNLGRTQVQNKLGKADEFYDLRKNVFFRPSKLEPHSTLAGDQLFIYTSAGSIITDANIDYIRKPRQISLSLNQTCELSGTASRLIVDATVEYLKLVIENPSYGAILQDNQLRNQNTLRNG